MSVLFCGSESADVLCTLFESLGTVAQPVRVPATHNPRNLPLGSEKQGVAVEWVLVHDQRWLYAFVSFWDHAPAELVVFEIDKSAPGALREVVHRTSTHGFQAAHAEVAGQTLAVAHYLSGSVSLFDVSAAASPVLLCVVALPDAAGAPRDLPAPPFTAPAFGAPLPLAHGVAFSPDGGWLMVADAGPYGRVAALRLADAGAARTVVGASVCSAIAAPEEIWGARGQDIVVSRIGHRPRHVAFGAAGVLYVVMECANTVTAHAFDAESGRVAPAHVSIGSGGALGAARLLCGAARVLAAALPLRLAFLAAVLPFGISAASEIAVHAPSGRVVVSNRGFRGIRSSLRVLEAGLGVVQDVPTVHPNPRHMAFVGEMLLVGVEGGVELYDVSAEGSLSLRCATRFGEPGEALQGLQVDCVAVSRE